MSKVKSRKIDKDEETDLNHQLGQAANETLQAFDLVNEFDDEYGLYFHSEYQKLLASALKDLKSAADKMEKMSYNATLKKKVDY